jgi:hypothetical protein
MKKISLKHKHVYICYLLLLKHIGVDAKYIARHKIYEDIAQFFYIDQTVVGRTICRIEKSNYRPDKYDIEDFKKLNTKLMGIIESTTKANYEEN